MNTRGNFSTLLESSAKRGAALVQQILSFVRGIAGANTLVEPRHLIHELATMAQATFPKSIAIIEEAPADIGAVEADATQLHQVLLNLCVNARDAIAEDGIITLRARSETLDCAHPDRARNPCAGKLHRPRSERYRQRHAAGSRCENFRPLLLH